MDFLSVSKKIEDFISRRVKSAGKKGVVLGLSGGLDSAVVATLSARALGPDNVLALMMPSQSNSPCDLEDAKEIAASLGINSGIIPIRSILESFSEHLGGGGSAMGNLAARIRMCILYYHANSLGYLVAGTGNKSELMVGYFTKYGDGGCDILPIGDLLKTDVWELAKAIGVPKNIIEKTPSAGLWPGQTDEEELGITYKELDKVLSGQEENMTIRKMINSSEHKRKPPEVCRL